MTTVKPLIDVAMTHTPDAPEPSAEWEPAGSVGDIAFLWTKRGDGDPVTNIAFEYDNKPVGEDDFIRVETNGAWNRDAGGFMHIWFQRSNRKDLVENPLADLQIIAGEKPLPDGFRKLGLPMNKDAPTSHPRLYLAYRKLDDVPFIPKVGDLIDCRDSVGKWEVARVLDATDEKMYVHYVRWSSKWDEWVKKSDWTYRFARYRKHTFDTEKPFDLKKEENKLDLILSRLDSISSALQQHVNNQQPSDSQPEFAHPEWAQSIKPSFWPLTTPLSALFSQEEIDFIVKADNAKFLPDVLNAKIEDEVLMQKALRYWEINLQFITYILRTETQPALLNHPFVHDAVARLFGSHPSYFYNHSGFDKSEEKKEQSFFVSGTSAYASQYLLRHVRMFAEYGGFDLIRFHLTSVTKTPVSFAQISHLIHIVEIASPFLNPTFLRSFVASLSLAQAIPAKLSASSDDELKAQDRGALKQLLADVRSLLKTTKTITDQELSAFLDQFALDVSIRMVNAQVLAIQLDGMTQLEGFLKQYYPPPPAKDASAGAVQEKPAPPSLPAELVCKRLESSVLEIVLGRDTHEQMVKRSVVILKFFALNNLLSPRHLDLLFNVAAGKHEALLRIVYDAFAELASSLKEEHLDAVFNRIKERPLKELKDYDINFLKSFTLNAVRSRLQQQEAKENKKEKFVEKWYGIELFWQILQAGDSSLSPEIVQLSASALAQLLGAPEMKSLLNEYLLKCVGALHPSAPTSGVVPALKLAETILSGQQADDSKNSRSEILQKLDSDNKLLNLCVEELVRYARGVNEQVAKTGSAPAAHEAQLKARLHFLAFASNNGQLPLSQNHADLLWSVFVKASSAQDRDQFLTWLGATVDGKTSKDHTLFAQKVNKYIFSDLLCNTTQIDLTQLSLAAFRCFESFFIHTNYVKETLFEPNKDVKSIVVINYSKLKGLDALWSLALSCKTPEVIEAASNLLVTLHIRVDFSASRKDKLAVIKSFADRCVQQMASSAKVIRTGKEEVKSSPSLSASSLFSSSSASNIPPVTDHPAAVLNAISLVDQLLTRSRTDMIERPLFSVGQVIRATWKNQTKEYGAKVAAINKTGTYYVKYDDGDEDKFCPESNLRVLDSDRAEMDKRIQENVNHPNVKRLFSEEKQYSDVLFDLLSFSTEIGTRALRLLSRLPTNAALQQQIASLPQSKTPVDWALFFPAHNYNKLIYTLSILEKLSVAPTLSEKEKEKQTEKEAKEEETRKQTILSWVDLFAQKGGLKHILSILMQEDEQSQSMPLELSHLLLHLLHAWLSSTQATADLTLSILDQNKAVSRLLNLMLGGTVRQQKEQKESEKKQEQKESASRSRASSPSGRSRSASPAPASSSSSTTPSTAPVLSKEDKNCAEIIEYTLKSLRLLLKATPELSANIMKFDQWEALLSAGLFSKTQVIREAVSKGLFSLFEVLPRLQVALLPRLLRCLQEIDSRAYSAVCSEFFDLLNRSYKQAVLKKSDKTDKEGKEEELSQQISSLSIEDASQEAVVFDRSALLRNCVEKLRQHPLLETDHTTVDSMLVGLMQMAAQLIEAGSAEQKTLGASGFVREVLLYVFEFPQTGGRNATSTRPPKCKSPKSRKAAYELLNSLANKCIPNARIIADFLTPLHNSPHGSKRHDLLYNYESKYEERSNTGYLGIKNLGCICYMIAPLQQFFMIPQFRQELLSVDEYKQPEDKENLLLQLQHLFAQMQESEESYIDPSPFCQAYKDDMGKPIDVRIQEDSSGFVATFLDRIEKALKGTKYEKSVTDVMRGVLSQELIGRGACKHYRERPEEFHGLQLEIKNKKTLEESLAAYVSGEVLEGGNQYKCDKCAKKVDTLKRTCIKKLPDHLFFTLKRFELDYETMQTTKVNDRLEFPPTINLKPFTKEGIAEKEYKDKLAALKQKQEGAASPSDGDEAKDGPSPATPTPSSPSAPSASGSSGSSGSSEPAPEQAVVDEAEVAALEAAKEVQPDDYYEYVLRGVVVHMGSAQGGHYYSFVQERNEDGSGGQWYKFNDHSVTPFDPAELEEECFGGVEEQPARGRMLTGPGASHVDLSKTVTTEKFRNAYILFYDRVKKGDANSSSSVVSSGKTKVALPPKMQEQISKQNQTLYRDRIIYEKPYAEFLLKVLNESGIVAASNPGPQEIGSWVPSLPSDPTQYSDTVALAQLGFRYMSVTGARAKDRELAAQIFQVLIALMEKDKQVACWLLSEFAGQNPGVYKKLIPDLLLDVPHEAELIRTYFGEIISYAVKAISPFEKDALAPGAHKFFYQSKEDKKEEAKTETPSSAKPASGFVVALIDHLICSEWNRITFWWRAFDPYFQVLLTFAKQGPLESLFLVREHNFLPRLLDMILCGESSHPELNPFFDLDNKGKRVPMSDSNGSVELTAALSLLKCLFLVSKQPAKLPLRMEEKDSLPESQISTDVITPYQANWFKRAGISLDQIVELDVLTADMLLAPGYRHGALYFLIRHPNRRVGSRDIVETIQHFCYENKEVSESVVKCISNLLRISDYHNSRGIFRVADGLFSMVDSLESVRSEALSSALVESIITNSQYWRMTDFSIEMLIRLAKKHIRLYKWMKGHQQPMEQMARWLKNSEFPQQAGLKLSKDVYDRNNSIQPYCTTLADKLNSLISIYQDKPLSEQILSDSDLEYEDRNFILGEWVDCKDTVGKWLCAQVVRVWDDGRVTVSFSGWSEKWNETLPNNSQRIAPCHSFTKTSAPKVAKIPEPEQ